MANIALYQGLRDDDVERLSADLERAYARASSQAQLQTRESDDADELPTIQTDVLSGDEVPPDSDLLGIDPAIYRQINAALKSGKQHLMFYGPPGTGKTTLAQHCARWLASKHTLITGSSDWSSQDVIGGYQPIGNGRIEFVPGILLRHFDRPLIIDELNRCDIDKVIGPLFTVLSGQKTTLPYRQRVEDPHSEFFELLPKPNPAARQGVEFAPSAAWRLIATINSIDKASLYQMSYALTRRFAWIYVDVPEDITDFLAQYFYREGIRDPDSEANPLSAIWLAVNAVRPVGPAPILDMIRAMRAMDSTLNFREAPTEVQAGIYLDSFDMFLLPMLDGIFQDSAQLLATAVADALGISAESSLGSRLHRRLTSISV
ncbi:AAA family ATPase [Paraburkholderia sp. SIMBA_054]|uniref:AAA family ATPase n=1 Tax=Paraburkholderia sp. SIMBA_054 TaxID=3085795 RepID=UPI00397AEE4C